VGDGYAQNAKTIREYGSAVQEDRFATSKGLAMSDEDLLRHEVIMRIMCHFRLDKREIAGKFDLDFDRHFAAELASLEPMAADGLVELGAGELEVTPRGRLLVRNVAMAFDAYLTAAPAGTATRYSRTV